MLLLRLLLILCLFSPDIFGQRIYYSRQTIKEPLADAMQLVADVNGYHHLVCVGSNKNVTIYAFNPQMQSFKTTAINLKIREACDMQLLPFSKYYFLYLHPRGTLKHYLYAVNGDGSYKDISPLLNRSADTAWNKSTAALQLLNDNGKLSILRLTYFDAIKKVGTTIVRFNEAMTPVEVQKVFFEFDKKEEILEQVVLAQNKLVVLKNTTLTENGSELRVVKIDLATGHTLIKTFNAGQFLYINPLLRYHASDSAVFVASFIREPIGSLRAQRSIFMSRLDFELHEAEPVALLRSQFRNNAAANFLFVDHKTGWLNMAVTYRIRAITNRNNATDMNIQNDNSYNLQSMKSYSLDQNSNSNVPSAIRFTLLNQQLRPAKDSVVGNDGNIYDVLPRPSSQFILGNKAYLALVQNFSPNKRGLLLLSAEGTKNFTSWNVPVYDRYQYLLPQLQAVRNEYFILPYTYKNEIGLVKVTMKE